MDVTINYNSSVWVLIIPSSDSAYSSITVKVNNLDSSTTSDDIPFSTAVMAFITLGAVYFIFGIIVLVVYSVTFRRTIEANLHNGNAFMIYENHRFPRTILQSTNQQSTNQISQINLQSNQIDNYENVVQSQNEICSPQHQLAVDASSQNNEILISDAVMPFQDEEELNFSFRSKS